MGQSVREVPRGDHLRALTAWEAAFGERDRTDIDRCSPHEDCAIRCDEIHEFLDLVHEAHVGHLVGFVEHGDRNFGEIHRTLVHQIDEPTRRGDNDVCASLEALDLPLVRRATDDELHRQLRLMCERCQCIAHLHGEFTGWHEHHGPRELRA